MLSTRFYFLFDALKSTVSACSVPVCRNQCGQNASQSWTVMFRRPRVGSVFYCRVTRSRTTAQRHLLPCVYPEFADRHKTSCGTSSRSNGSCPLQNVLSPHALMHRHTLHRRSAGEVLPSDEWRAYAACDSNCGLCSIVITP